MSEGAEVGARLVGEGWGQAEGLGELLAALRAMAHTDDDVVFGVPALDRLLATSTSAQHGSTANPDASTHTAAVQSRHDDDDSWIPPVSHQHHHPSTPALPSPTNTNAAPATQPQPQTHILTLLSPPPAQHPSPAAKSSLIHLLTTHAILPPTLLSVPLHGLARTLILLDPLHHFSAARLSQILLAHIAACFQAAGRSPELRDPHVKKEVLQCVRASLDHVHVIQPVGWAGLLSALKGLEAYVFDEMGGRHRSFERPVHALVLEDVQHFTPYLRVAATANAPSSSGSAAAAVAGAGKTLAALLAHLVAALATNVVLTSSAPFPFPALVSQFSASLAAGRAYASSRVVATRMMVQRVEVRRFAPGMSVEEAWREREMRWEVVRRGRFVCKRVGGAAGKDGLKGKKGGFVFCVGKGVVVEREGEQEDGVSGEERLPMVRNA